MSEAQYKNVVKGRLEKTDFVVEDEGADGYMDNGMDDWSEGEGYDSEEDDAPKNKKNCKLHALIRVIILKFLSQVQAQG